MNFLIIYKTQKLAVLIHQSTNSWKFHLKASLNPKQYRSEIKSFPCSISWSSLNIVSSSGILTRQLSSFHSAILISSANIGSSNRGQHAEDTAFTSSCRKTLNETGMASLQSRFFNWSRIIWWGSLRSSMLVSSVWQYLWCSGQFWVWHSMLQHGAILQTEHFLEVPLQHKKIRHIWSLINSLWKPLKYDVIVKQGEGIVKKKVKLRMQSLLSVSLFQGGVGEG